MRVSHFLSFLNNAHNANGKLMPKPKLMPCYINKYKERLPEIQAYLNESDHCGLKYRLKVMKFNHRCPRVSLKKCF